ncbi:hypothetical protein, partial [Chelonobacter oris]|uniref:hypothetical protein n=1 Tax=Chelonobacter oris TaxID=505317 RepID=UPI003CC5DBC6
VRVIAFLLKIEGEKNKWMALDVQSSERFYNMINAEKEREKRLEQEKRDMNVPGIEELREAYLQNEIAYENRRSSIEQGTGVILGDEENTRLKVQELEEKYPRAALWHKANGYTNSSNIDKYSAGAKARDLLENGGDMKEAEHILDNWLKKVWDNETDDKAQENEVQTEQPAATEPQVEDDRAFLQDVIDGKIDVLADDFYAKMEEIATRVYEYDQDLVAKAVEAYTLKTDEYAQQEDE